MAVWPWVWRRRGAPRLSVFLQNEGGLVDWNCVYFGKFATESSGVAGMAAKPQIKGLTPWDHWLCSRHVKNGVSCGCLGDKQDDMRLFGG